jgi:uncharacterized damage-inducible protein DinB
MRGARGGAHGGGSAMAMAQALIGELDHEAAGGRRVLERVPEGKFAWKPHARSWSAGDLASHVANMLSWGSITLGTTEYDLASAPDRSPAHPTSAALLAKYDANRAAFRAALQRASDGDLMVPWSLKREGVVLFTFPRVACLRSFVLNHFIHHRAQLTVYLRLLDVSVPALYGPSADERP